MSFVNSKIKGSIPVGRGNGFGVLPVGTDGQVLSADSSTATGTNWVNAVSPTYVFTSPDTLTITDNALIPWIPGAGRSISQLLALVKTAPTGASIIVEFFRGTLATGVVGASLGTVTIVAGDFTASTAITPTTIATTEFVAMTINQVGSTIAGSNLTGLAR